VTTECHYCRKLIFPDDDVRQAVWGWEARAETRTSRKGGSDIQLRQPFNRFAHTKCIALVRAGVSVDQETLV
jgi:hypothetical protein